MKKLTLKVCVVSFPWKSYAPYKFLSDVLKILEPISDNVVIIDGNTSRINIPSKKVEVRDIGMSMHHLKNIKLRFHSAILWITKCVLVQFKTSLELIKAKKEVDVVIFYVAYPYYLLPLITAKTFRKKTVEVITRSKPNSSLSKILRLQDPLLFRLLDGISPESKELTRELCLEKYKNKLLPEGARFIDVSRYTVKKTLNERKNVVGFIGRLRKEKGVVEFVEAIPLVARENKDVEILIGGSGDLLGWVKEECKRIENGNNIKITITGFIKEEEFPNYLNEPKLLALPTQHAEGLPTVILEAMACGTPVLATPVGGIPDVIKDGETGFIMENNSPECIAKNIVRVLEYPDLDKVTKNARKLIEEKYTYKAAVERYRRIFKKLQ